jgi:hypothetical protein
MQFNALLARIESAKQRRILYEMKERLAKKEALTQGKKEETKK